MPEYSYDRDDQRFEDSRSYYDFDEREWHSPELERTRPGHRLDRPSSKPWWIEMGVDMPDAPRTNRPAEKRTAYQDPFDDDMSRIRKVIPISESEQRLLPFTLYHYLYRNSEWFAWN